MLCRLFYFERNYYTQYRNKSTPYTRLSRGIFINPGISFKGLKSLIVLTNKSTVF
jgi:hypothetical protein